MEFIIEMGNIFSKKTEEFKTNKAVLPSFPIDEKVHPPIPLPEDFIKLSKLEVKIMNVLAESCSRQIIKEMSYEDFSYRIYYKRLHKLKPTIMNNLKHEIKGISVFSNPSTSFILLLTKKYLREQIDLLT
mmetsp:Transcript_23905/g.21249  ORF Transcript_23905/g.21249 Transcript_23905/m.21249 type:complete len:130 (+) Transcript_23905:9-398(+)